MNKYKITSLAVLFFLSGNLAANPANLPEGLLELKPVLAPLTELWDMDGKKYNLQQHKGSIVFVHFWAGWCRPCQREMPAIQRMWNILEKEGLKIALINTAEDEDAVFSFLSIHAPNIRALLDRDGQITEKWQPRGLPASYIVDAKGFILYQALGGRPWDEQTYVDFLRLLIRQSK